MDRTRRAPSRRKPGEVSLERALSKLGLASRTQARALILDGKVKVDGRSTRNPGLPVVPERVKLTIEGRDAERAEWRAIALHKPRGVVTTRSDEKGRPTVYSALEGVDTYLSPVGRLDLATTGLLLLTNDTRLASWLTDPENEVPRRYVVTVRGEVSDESLAQMREGVRDEGELLSASEVKLLKRSGRESHLELELVEGKNREIRRLCLALGHEVTRLKRVAFGGLELGELPAGKWRELTREELKVAFPGAPLTPQARPARA